MDAARIKETDPVQVYVQQILTALDELGSLEILGKGWKKALRRTESIILEVDAIKVVTQDRDVLKQLKHIEQACKEIELKGQHDSKAMGSALRQIKNACNNILISY